MDDNFTSNAQYGTDIKYFLELPGRAKVEGRDFIPTANSAYPCSFLSKKLFQPLSTD